MKELVERWYFGKRWWIATSFLFEPRDVWIGLYWCRTFEPKTWMDREPTVPVLNLYICPFPMLVLRIEICPDYKRCR